MCSMSRYIQNIFKQIQLYLIFQGNHYPLSCQTIYEWYFSPNVIAVTGYIPGFLDEVRVAHLFSFLCCALSWLFSFWVLGPNAAYVSGLFVFVLGPGPKCCLRIWIVCFCSGSWVQMLPTYLDGLFSFWVLGPNAVYVSELFVFVLGPGPKCCLCIWIVFSNI